MSTTVVYRRFEEEDVRIDYGVWRNPFTIDLENTHEDCVRKHADWIIEQPHLMSRIGELKGKRLGCYCKHPDLPRACHGDTLALLADNYGTTADLDEDILDLIG